MREILFRGKSKNYRSNVKDKQWVYGSLVRGEVLFPERKEEYFIVELRNRGDCTYEIIPETLCQYTGMNDKNGNRIWENDIVSFIDMTSTESGYCERNCFGRVAWDIEEACFFVTDRLSSESWEVLQDCYAVGNIFDNPELLKGE